MCGRYALYTDPRKIAETFGLEAPVEYHVSYNIAPTQDILCITQNEAGARLGGLYRWGLVPFWSKEIGRYSTINARAETVATKPTYREPFKKRRCLIPANGYFEWQARPGKPKQPYFIHPKDEGLIAFAGLWDRWKRPEGPELKSASIIVTTANQDTKPIHDRMPVILPQEVWDVWLDIENHEAKALERLLRPAAPRFLEAEPVSTRVNSPKNQGPELLSQERV